MWYTNNSAIFLNSQEFLFKSQLKLITCKSGMGEGGDVWPRLRSVTVKLSIANTSRRSWVLSLTISIRVFNRKLLCYVILGNISHVFMILNDEACSEKQIGIFQFLKTSLLPRSENITSHRLFFTRSVRSHFT